MTRVVMKGGKLLAVGGKLTTCQTACCGCFGCEFPNPLNVSVKVTIGGATGTVTLPFSVVSGESTPFQNFCDRTVAWSHTVTSGISNSPLQITRSYSRNRTATLNRTGLVNPAFPGNGTFQCLANRSYTTTASIRYVLSSLSIRIVASKTLTDRTMAVTLSANFAALNNTYSISFANSYSEFFDDLPPGTVFYPGCMFPSVPANCSSVRVGSTAFPGRLQWLISCDLPCPSVVACISGNWGNTSRSYTQGFSRSFPMTDTCSSLRPQVFTTTQSGIVVGTVPTFFPANLCCNGAFGYTTDVSSGDTTAITLPDTVFEVTV